MEDNDPETLYRAASANLVYQGNPDTVNYKLGVLAHCIKGLYLDQDRKPPEDNIQLAIELGNYADTLTDAVEDAHEIVEIAENRIYIEEHGLTHLLDMLTNALDASDLSLDTAFICDLHKNTDESDLSTIDEVQLVTLYQLWLMGYMLM